MKQDLGFYKPMFTNQNYNAVFEVVDVLISKNRAVVKTIILDELKEIVIKGEALIKHHRIC